MEPAVVVELAPEDPRNVGRVFKPFFTYHWDEESAKWLPVAFSCPVAPATPPASPTLVPEATAAPTQQIVTYNVLFDKFQRDEIETAARFPHIAALLESRGADVLVLQEVTIPFVRKLLKLPWVRKHYWCSDSDAGIAVEPYGQLVLAKLPFAHSFVKFSSQKTASVCSFHLHGGVWLGLAAVHLTSNYHDGTSTDGAAGVTAWAQRRREAQLQVLLEALAPYGAAAVVGDFNYDPEQDEPDVPALGQHYVDAWRALRGHEDGVTFDSERNPTAVITSKSAKRRRYDRVCVRGLQPLAVALAGTQRCVLQGALCPSDHYAVAAHVAAPHAPPRRHFDSVGALLAAQAKAIGTAEDETRRRLAVAQHLQAVLGCPVTAVGSTALGCVLRDSDLDCVVDLALEQVHARLAAAGVLLEPYAEEAGVVRCSVDGVHVDVQHCADGAALRHVQALLQAFGPHHGAYVAALRFIKLWATRLGVYGNTFGYPNGLALAVMLVRAGAGASTADDLVHRFFDLFADYDWSRPVLMHAAQRYHTGRQPDLLPIGAPGDGASIVRNATRSSLWALRTAFAGAKGLDPAALLLQWRDPSGQPDFYQRYACYVHVEMVSDVRASLARLVGLVLELETQHGVLCHVHSTVHQHGNDGGESACVLLGCDRELPLLPALLHDPNRVCTLQCYPVCRRRHHFRCEAVAAAVPAAVGNDNNAPLEAAAAAANNNNNEPPVDFEALAAGCKTSEEILKMVKWHPAFEGGQATEIGWEDRFLGLIRKPALSYVPGGAVPFHRVMCFWHRGVLIWWRGNKEDYAGK